MLPAHGVAGASKARGQVEPTLARERLHFVSAAQSGSLSEARRLCSEFPRVEPSRPSGVRFQHGHLWSHPLPRGSLSALRHYPPRRFSPLSTSFSFVRRHSSQGNSRRPSKSGRRNQGPHTIAPSRRGNLSCWQNRSSMVSSLTPECRGSASRIRRRVGLQLSVPGSLAPAALASATFVYQR
jgi:hypothetical protein